MLGFQIEKTSTFQHLSAPKIKALSILLASSFDDLITRCEPGPPNAVAMRWGAL